MVACLCIHGFTGSPSEVKPLADYLREHTDWDVLAPTLPGHDHLRHLKNVTYKDWIVFVDSILSQMLKEDDEVYIIGFSMGGLLAGWLARHYPEVKKTSTSKHSRKCNGMATTCRKFQASINGSKRSHAQKQPNVQTLPKESNGNALDFHATIQKNGSFSKASF